MTDREFRRRSRRELVEIIYRLQKQKEQLQMELADARQQLACRQVRLSRAGTLAEAALALGGFWEAAERSAACYLEQLRDLTEREAGRRDREVEAAS